MLPIVVMINFLQYLDEAAHSGWPADLVDFCKYQRILYAQRAAR